MTTITTGLDHISQLDLHQRVHTIFGQFMKDKEADRIMITLNELDEEEIDWLAEYLARIKRDI